jgi:hypothetical protein
MVGFKNGTSYAFVAWASNSLGTIGRAQVTFTVAIPATLPPPPATSPEGVFHFPTDINLIGGVTFHFGHEWFSTTSQYATITGWFVNNWVNYTVPGAGTQTIYNGTKPTVVYINGISHVEGDGWSYASGAVTVIAATSSGWLYFGVYNGPRKTPQDYYLISWVVTLKGTPVSGARVMLYDAAYGWIMGQADTDKGVAEQSMPLGTYNYTISYQKYKINGTLIHTGDETVAVDLATGTARVVGALGERVKILVIAIVIIVGCVLIFGVVKKSGRKR